MKGLALILLLASGIALADDAGILRCRAIKDSAARLACYDALVVPAAAASPAPGAAATAATAQPASRSPAQTPEQFGLEQRKAEARLEAIESSIPGRFDGWGPGASFRLANGQVWQVADGSSGAHWIENPKVRVRRGTLGAFYLEIEGTNRSPRVTRVR